MLCGFLLDFLITQCASIFQLFSCENQSLLLMWDTFFILNLGLHILNVIVGFHVQCDCLSCQCLHDYLHSHFLSIDSTNEFEKNETVAAKRKLKSKSCYETELKFFVLLMK
eukprot:323790_1